jgi:hypothetical protein
LRLRPLQLLELCHARVRALPPEGQVDVGAGLLCKAKRAQEGLEFLRRRFAIRDQHPADEDTAVTRLQVHDRLAQLHLLGRRQRARLTLLVGVLGMIQCRPRRVGKDADRPEDVCVELRTKALERVDRVRRPLVELDSDGGHSNLL